MPTLRGEMKVRERKRGGEGVGIQNEEEGKRGGGRCNEVEESRRECKLRKIHM